MPRVRAERERPARSIPPVSSDSARPLRLTPFLPSLTLLSSSPWDFSSQSELCDSIYPDYANYPIDALRRIAPPRFQAEAWERVTAVKTAHPPRLGWLLRHSPSACRIGNSRSSRLSTRLDHLSPATVRSALPTGLLFRDGPDSRSFAVRNGTGLVTRPDWCGQDASSGFSGGIQLRSRLRQKMIRRPCTRRGESSTERMP